MKKFWKTGRVEALDLGLLVVVAVVWRFVMLPHFPFHEDETATITVMQSIARSGLPLMDNGLFYWRALLAHYLMALPLLVLPVNEYSVRLVPVLVSGAVLVLVYVMARRAGGRWAAWLSVLFLASSAFEQDQASFARFYMLFQFCFLLTVYFAGRYLVEGDEQYGKWFFLALAATFGTHEMAIELLPVGLLALLIGRQFKLLRRPTFWWGCAVSILVILMTVTLGMVIRPSWVFVNYLAAPLTPGEMQNKAFYYEAIKFYLPFGLSLALGGLVAVWTSERRIWRFYLGSFAVCLVGLSLISPAELLRYMGNLFPLGVLAAALAAEWFVLSAYRVAKDRRWRQLGLPVAGLVLSVGHLAIAGDWRVDNAFGQTLTSPDQRPPHEFLRERMAVGDVLISLDPGLSGIYLGRPANYFLREKAEAVNHRFRPYTTKEKSALTIPVIDSPQILAQVLANASGRIWIYANHKFNMTLSQEMHRLIRTEFRVVYFRGVGAVLLHEPKNK